MNKSVVSIWLLQPINIPPDGAASILVAFRIHNGSSEHLSLAHAGQINTLKWNQMHAEHMKNSSLPVWHSGRTWLHARSRGQSRRPWPLVKSLTGTVCPCPVSPLNPLKSHGYPPDFVTRSLLVCFKHLNHCKEMTGLSSLEALINPYFT